MFYLNSFSNLIRACDLVICPGSRSSYLSGCCLPPCIPVLPSYLPTVTLLPQHGQLCTSILARGSSRRSLQAKENRPEDGKNVDWRQKANSRPPASRRHWAADATLSYERGFSTARKRVRVHARLLWFSLTFTSF